MRYYVVINGESSLNIQGLAIQSLPNISKPLMRSRREEIDGRDGDIITKLGYSAYDKTLKIGLWGNYDINQVIAFFNQEGVITFSNEPDKYYNFTILNREDYINKLEAFREASITIHCQPFKYELNEQPIELDNEYVEETDTSMTFDNSLVADMDISLKGNTSQTGTPTPSTPIPVNVVSGDNKIYVSSGNLFKLPSTINQTLNGITYTLNEDGSLTMSGTANANSDIILPLDYSLDLDGTYIFSLDITGTIQPVGYQQWILRSGNNNTSLNPSVANNIVKSVSTTLTSTIDGIRIYTANGATLNCTIKPQLEVGNTYTGFKEYKGIEQLPINLPVENKFNYSNVSTIINGSIDNNIITSNAISSGYGGVSATFSGLTLQTGTYSISLKAKLESGSASGVNGITRLTTPSAPITQIKTPTLSSSYQLYTAKLVCTETTTITSLGLQLGSTNTNAVVKIKEIQIEQGEKVNSYVPYGTTPIELCKIGTYQDYFYNNNGTWYLHKEVGKVVLDGSESWTGNGQTSELYEFYTTSANKAYGIANFIMDKFEVINGQLTSYYQANGRDNNNRIFIRVKTSDLTSYSDTALKTWLSTNNIKTYYVLSTTTDIAITYTPLINQLNAILEAQSKNGTTNITQVNNDLPFIITASVLCGSNSVVVNNKGNIYSKPIMTIYGSGNIGVYLSDSQIFNINLGDEEYITLDTANMEAYKVGVLKNRLVNGDYNSFRLETGNNTISFTGNVTKVELENYSRWI